MVEVESSVAAGRQPDVHNVVRAGDEADEAGDEKHGRLRSVVWFDQRVRTHHDQPDADDEQGECGQHRAPVFPHLRVPPAVGVRFARRQVPVLLYQRITIPGGGIIGVL